MAKHKSAQLDARREAKLYVGNPRNIVKPTYYAGCILIPAAGGFDVINRNTGQWMHVSTQRMAKWNASVYTRLSDEFGASHPRDIPAIEDTTGE